MGWQILGISDEVETCEHCSKTGLKRTVCLTDGEGELYVGTTCAANMMGVRKEYVAKKAHEAQYEADKERESQEWSSILNSMHYQFLKNNVHFSEAVRSEKKIRMGFDRVVEQSGLSAECVLSHLRQRWDSEKLAELEGR